MKNVITKPEGILPSINANGSVPTADDARRELTRIISCPTCLCNFKVAQDTDMDALIRCGGCPKQFALIDGLPTLDFLEIKLVAMVIGLWVFFSQCVPAWCRDQVLRLLQKIERLLNWLVPYLLKLVRVGGWLTVWLSILFGPTVVCAGAAYSLTVVGPAQNPFSWGLWGLGGVWLLAVGTGYTWAYRCYRLKRKISETANPLTNKRAYLGRIGAGAAAAIRRLMAAAPPVVQKSSD